MVGDKITSEAITDEYAKADDIYIAKTIVSLCCPVDSSTPTFSLDATMANPRPYLSRISPKRTRITDLFKATVTAAGEVSLPLAIPPLCAPLLPPTILPPQPLLLPFLLFPLRLLPLPRTAALRKVVWSLRPRTRRIPCNLGTNPLRGHPCLSPLRPRFRHLRRPEN